MSTKFGFVKANLQEKAYKENYRVDFGYVTAPKFPGPMFPRESKIGTVRSRPAKKPVRGNVSPKKRMKPPKVSPPPPARKKPPPIILNWQKLLSTCNAEIKFTSEKGLQTLLRILHRFEHSTQLLRASDATPEKDSTNVQSLIDRISNTGWSASETCATVLHRVPFRLFKLQDGAGENYWLMLRPKSRKQKKKEEATKRKVARKKWRAMKRRIKRKNRIRSEVRSTKPNQEPQNPHRGIVNIGNAWPVSAS